MMRVCASIRHHRCRHWPGIALLLVASWPLPAGAARITLPAAAGYAASNHYRLLLCLGQPAAGGAWTAPGSGAGLLVDCEFGAPAPPLLSDGVGGLLGALRLELMESVSGATVYYRRGGELGYSALAMTPAPGGRVWSATLPAEALGARGIQYYIEIADPPFALRAPAGAPGAGHASFAIPVADYEAFALGAAPRSYFLGLPLAPAGGDPTLIFGGALGDYGPPRWQLFVYDAASAGYRDGPDAGLLAAGHGFWLSSAAAAFVAIAGQSALLSADLEFVLAPGWNALANPFAFPLSVRALRGADGAPHNLYAYRPSALADYEDAASGELSTIAPGEAFWVENAGTSPLDFIIPASPQEAPAAPPLPAPELAEGEAGWCLQLRATTGRVGASRARCGQRLGASAARDPFDYGEPPAPPAGALSLAWRSAEDQRLACDWRGLGGTGERWLLELDSDQAGADVRIEGLLTGALPAGWSLVAVDAATFAETPLLPDLALAGRLRSSPRRWHLLAGDGAFLAAARSAIAGEFAAGLDAFALWPAQPNPCRRAEGALIALAAPRAAAASLRIFDVQGRLVRRLHEGPVAAGLARFTWQGEDERGARVAAGVYFVRAEAPGLSATRKLVLLD